MSHIQPFKLERYFAKYEFAAPYLLSPSDCETLSLKELLALASPETAAAWEELRLGYTESAGHPRLRGEIAGLYQTLTPEDILVLAPEEGIFIAMHTLLEPGDEVVAISPAYQSLYEIARSIGCRVKPWTVRLGDDGWRLDLDELAASITGRARLLVINFPHNPTGLLPQPDELQAIIDLARQHGLYLFSDEMYRLLEYDPGQRLPAVCDLYEKGISLSGMSKSLALPGLRIGWLGARSPELLARWQAFKDYTTICSSAPSEILAWIALQARQQILDRSLEIVRANLGYAQSFFSRHPDSFRWIPPQAGSVAFPQYLGPGSVDDFCQSVLDSQGVMIVPASIFDYPGPHFRLGLGRRSFPAALERVERFL